MIIIDNHSEYNDKLFLLLKKNNYNADFIFENDRRALNYLRNNITSVVFCDLKFAEKNGVNLTKKIKNINPLCKVYFTSMYTTNYIIYWIISTLKDCVLSLFVLLEQTML